MHLEFTTARCRQRKTEASAGSQEKTAPQPWLAIWVMASLLCISCTAPEKIEERTSQGNLADGGAWFEEVAMERGIDFRFKSGHREHFFMPEIMAGGAALLDMDNDGDLDAYLVQGGDLNDERGATPYNQLYRNLGAGQFENATAGSGADDRGYGMGVAAGDYDSDGDTDLFVTNVGPNVLLRSTGAGQFDEVTAAAGVGDGAWSASAAFVDYDRDGDLDLYATRYMNWSKEMEKDCRNPVGELDYCYPPIYEAQEPDLLYQNNGDGTFTDVSLAAGLHAAYGYGLGVVCGDFDGDGWTDIFVANDGSKNQLWVNQGDGTFVDQAQLRGCALDESGRAKAGMGVSAIDIDDDGTLDLLVVNLRQQTDSFFRNQGEYFTDATASVGLVWDRGAFARFGVGIHDFDNDSLLDLYAANGSIGRVTNYVQYAADPFAEPNLLFRGRPGTRFEEVLPRGGVGKPLIATSRAAAFGDVDDDGGVDVLIVNRDARAYLLHNVVKDRGNWVTMRILNQHGSDALGAVVTFDVAGVRKTREVRSAYSYQAANDPRIHVGLGAANTISRVIVRWPRGHRESFGAFSWGEQITLQWGRGVEIQADQIPTPTR